MRIRSTRLVSLTHRSIVAIEYEVEPLDDGARIVLQSELVANEELPGSGKDPRTAAVLANPLEPMEQDAAGLRLELLHRTRRSGIGVAVAADHVVEGTDGLDWSSSSEIRPDWGRVTVTAALRPGQKLRLVKFVSYGWSSVRSRPALRDQVAAGLTGALHTGWNGLLRDQREFLDEFWQGADVTVEGDEALQQAVRFALFHVLQNSARAEERPIAAKGLTGPGYDGHCFWDTDSFVLPVLVHTWPEAAGDHLRWRHRTLDAARHRAAQLRLAGAAFPWRTINGEECSGYWPAGTAAFHVNADVADAVIRYHDATRDDEFDAEVGLEILVETARLWVSLGHHDREGGWHISGVTGPDEYSAISDDNVYTNLMAERNLRAAAAAVRHRPERAADLGVTGGGGRGLAAGRGRRRRAVRRGAGGARAVRRLHRARGVGLRRDAAATPTRCCCTTRTSTSTASRSSSRPTSCWPCRPAETGSRRSRRRRTSPTTRRSPCGTRRCRRSPRPFWRPRWAASTSPTRTPARRRSSTCTTWPGTPGTGCTWRRSRAPGSRSCRASAGCATIAGCWSSRRGCRRRSPGCRSRSATGATGCGSRPTAREATYTLFDHDSEIQLRHHGTEFTIRSGEPVTAPVPPPPTPAAGHASRPAGSRGSVSAEVRAEAHPEQGPRILQLGGGPNGVAGYLAVPADVAAVAQPRRHVVRRR